MRDGYTVDVVGSRMYIIGGNNSRRGRMPDIYFFDICKQAWSMMFPERVVGPSVRMANHASTLVGDSLFILVWKLLFKLDLVEETWTCFWDDSNILPKNSHVMFEYIEHREECIAFGGYTDEGREKNNLTALNVENLQWSRLRVDGKRPQKLANTSSCIVGTSIFLFGGHRNGASLDDLGVLHCEGYGAVRWSMPKVRGIKPIARNDATITNLFNGKLLVLGGYTMKVSEGTNDMWLYSIAKNEWTNLKSTKAVSGHIPNIARHSVAYFGTSLVIIGSNLRFVSWGDTGGCATLNGV